jgi:hypothetical protein
MLQIHGTDSVGVIDTLLVPADHPLRTIKRFADAAVGRP